MNRTMKALILASCCIPGVATAQAANPRQDGEPTTSVDDVIVTAQRREERLQDVPISITVLSAEAIEKTGAKSVSELQGVIPGFYASGAPSYGNAPLAIRGVAGFAQTLGDDPVAVYVDEVYYGRNGAFASGAMADIASLEVVRGPQGTLQGRNATTGAILLRTANPDDALGGRLVVAVADPREIKVQGTITGPITDTLSARLSAGYVDERGWATNAFDGGRLGSSDSQVIRGILRWAPEGPFQARASAYWSRSESSPAIVRWAQTPTNPNPLGARVPAGTATPTTALPDAEQRRIREEDIYSLNRPQQDKVDVYGSSLTASYDFGWAELVSISGYQDWDLIGASDSDGIADTAREGFNDGGSTSRQVSQELRLASPSDQALTWLVGAYYFDEDQSLDFNIRNYRYSIPTRSVTNFSGDQRTRSYAAFADLTWRPSEQWSIIGGVRSSREEKAFALNIRGTNIDTGVVTANTQYRPVRARWDDVSWRAKIAYEPVEDVLLYVSYSKGFKSGGFNAFGVDPAFNPETLLSLEAGAKFSAFDNKLIAAVSAYSNAYDDLQIRAGVPTGGVAIINAADSTIDGFEAEFTARPVEGLSLTANMAYADARFGAFTTARDILDRPADATGNRLVRFPEWQYYVAADYERPLTQDLTLAVRADWRWRDTIYLYQTNQDASTLQGEPLGELGARVALRNDAGGWDVAVYGNNLTNDRSISGGNTSFSYPVVTFNRPRVVGVELSKSF